MYGAEDVFAERISQSRRKEISKIRQCLFIFSALMSLFYFGGKIVIYASLVTYTGIGHNLLDSEMVYLTFSVLNKLSFIMLLYLPHFVLSLINGLIAIRVGTHLITYLGSRRERTSEF